MTELPGICGFLKPVLLYFMIQVMHRRDFENLGARQVCVQSRAPLCVIHVSWLLCLSLSFSDSSFSLFCSLPVCGCRHWELATLTSGSSESNPRISLLPVLCRFTRWEKTIIGAQTLVGTSENNTQVLEHLLACTCPRTY